MSDALLTAREVAAMLGVSAETVLRWTRRGELPAIRLPSGAVRYRAGEVDGWLTSRATPVRGVVTHPAGRRPPATLDVVTHPEREE